MRKLFLACLLAMFARTAKAAEFRRWVLDVLDREVEQPIATPAPVLARPPKLSRDDLSFTRRDAEGRLSNWAVTPRQRMWADGIDRGAAFFEEVAELAANDEAEAYDAVQFAFVGEWATAPDSNGQWSNRGAGEECGFAAAVARAVIDGLRARREGAEPFDPDRKTRQRGRSRSKGSVLMPPTQQRLLA